MATTPKRYDILGVQVDSCTIAESIELIAKRTQQPGASYVTKPYVEFFDKAHNDKQIMVTLNSGYLSLPDGVSTQWAAQYLYGGRRWWGRALWLAAQIILRPSAIKKAIPQKFGGADFTWQLLEYCSKHNLKVYLIGSPKSGSIATTTAAILRRLPKLSIVGTRPGELSGLRGDALLQALRQKKPVAGELLEDLKLKQPDVVLVGLGFPIQELLMHQLAAELKNGVLIGEGGTFDYDSFGGIRKRAPQWMRQIGIEWLWRLTLEPTRIDRQRSIPRFMWRIYQQGKKLPR